MCVYADVCVCRCVCMQLFSILLVFSFKWKVHNTVCLNSVTVGTESTASSLAWWPSRSRKPGMSSSPPIPWSSLMSTYSAVICVHNIIRNTSSSLKGESSFGLKTVGYNSEHGPCHGFLLVVISHCLAHTGIVTGIPANTSEQKMSLRGGIPCSPLHLFHSLWCHLMPLPHPWALAPTQLLYRQYQNYPPA